MRRLYLYPVTPESKTDINPYTDYLSDALEKHFVVVNARKPSRSGIFELIAYIRKIDLVYLNWVEDLPGLRGGGIQSVFFLMLLPLLRMMGIKIIWTLHNRQSHQESHSLLKSLLYRNMIRRSDLIITHASEGLDYIGSNTPSAFIHHPVVLRDPMETEPAEKEYDIIIWGNIAPYKGVDTFLEFLAERGFLDRYRILIAGRITTRDLAERIRSIRAGTRNLQLIDAYIPRDDLYYLIRGSRIVLFSYHSESVLSSGALMDSLSLSAIILGPSTGAFNDLSKLGLIDTFTDYNELLQKIDQLISMEGQMKPRRENIHQFLRDHSWDRFSEHLKILTDRYL